MTPATWDGITTCMISRALLRAIPGVELLEMERNRENGCAAAADVDGGGCGQARESGAYRAGAGCISDDDQFSLSVLPDDAGGRHEAEGSGRKRKTRDIAEILELSVFGLSEIHEQEVVVQ